MKQEEEDDGAAGALRTAQSVPRFCPIWGARAHISQAVGENLNTRRAEGAEWPGGLANVQEEDVMIGTACNQGVVDAMKKCDYRSVFVGVYRAYRLEGIWTE